MSDIFARTYGVELICSSPPSIPRSVFLQHLERRCPGAQPLDPDPQSKSLNVVHPAHPVQLTDARIAAQTMVLTSPGAGKPDRWSSALQQAWDFKNASEVLSRCQATVLVSDLMSSSLEYKERLDLFQRTLRAVLDTEKCDAIYWRPSDRLVDARTWVNTFDAGNPTHLFTAGAVNVRLFNINSPEDKSGEAMVMDTLGLGALGLPDLQCHFQGLDPGAVASLLYNTAWYIFGAGDVIANGHTIQGVTPGSRWRCQHEDALVGPARMVLDLDPGPPYAAGGRTG